MSVMTIDEYEPDSLMWEINRKLANVSLQSGLHDEEDYLTVSSAAWALSNFAGESAPFRELLADNSALTAVSNALNDEFDYIYDEAERASYQSGHLRIVDPDVCADIKAMTWAISNMSRGGFRTAEHWAMYVSTFNVLSKYIVFEHKDLWIEACWGLSRILYNMHDVSPFYEHAQISASLCAKLAQLLGDSEMSIVAPALRTVINLTSGPDELSSRMLGSTVVLRNITRLMQADVASSIRKDAFLVVSNFAASNLDVVQKVLGCPGLMQCVLSHIRAFGNSFNERNKWKFPIEPRKAYHAQEEWNITKECLWILCNVTTLATDENICLLLSDYPTLPKLLSGLLYYIHVPHNVCIKAIDLIINLIARTNKLTDVLPALNPRPANPYVREFIDLGVRDVLPSLCEASEKWSMLYERCAVLSSMLVDVEEKEKDAAEQFGLMSSKYSTTGANKRRVLHGLEDGDVRFIENALNTVSISEKV
ncbi:Importin alpha subunit (Karyopherin alpha subunit) (Serine-rich RNA polymerase I suppressor protein) [Apophysomyces ossiformis]|uniref:Importin alpha subunit (Karyopherin alpha subunit) (Serine-rich RNA polymerase I suppressor protein) n=1 Tax=Apophysomyces ossiformis TaxID=679940 RepID=A0A8H7BRK1_9FUNG|nr:Importin alpha subunit (Karyopherin alpha subunit) (Serine-rich RNA polymerase I suppressor protein) [Apophysomyces ossiformis]